jgi:selenide, water dikinase
LDKVLGRLPKASHANVLVGFDTSDDAGVYRLSPECALVQTVDFFTPIVDDPFTFGAIAAANALSDVYAMGGRPITALSILAYPGKGDLDALEEILRGGAAKMAEAACPVIGGHSVNDEEVKFGYSVTGTIHPEKIWKNSGAKPGDVLMFTKRIGTGVIGTAIKRGVATNEMIATCTESMLLLNKEAALVLESLHVNGCTDVTGFGLMGHGREMALGSNVTLEIEASRVPLLPGAIECVRAGAVPGGLRNNRDFASCVVEVAAGIDADIETLLYDPQTSGGLLVSLPEADASAFAERFTNAVRIGRVTESQGKAIRVL